VQKDESSLRHDWPLWAPLVQAGGVFLLHGALPFGVSRILDRHGWSAGHPATWNLLGLVPVAGAGAVLVWIIVLHTRAALRHGWRMAPTPFEPTQYLLVSGPYGYSRNPIYLSHCVIWSGWALFYGSVAVLVGVVVLWAVLAFVVVPYEERGLERQLGEAYRQYQQHVPRWLGPRLVG
jgi:protein-S-isoprenylcysteine O-methyltransferase Ste14